jgi:hypothetical protein
VQAYIRARAHYVASSAATPPPINIRRTAIPRGHATARTTTAVSTFKKKTVLRFRTSDLAGKCHPGPRISEQSPVLTRYRKRIRGNIQIHPPSCDEPHGDGGATDYGLQGTELEPEQLATRKTLPESDAPEPEQGAGNRAVFLAAPKGASRRRIRIRFSVLGSRFWFWFWGCGCGYYPGWPGCWG